VIYEYPAIDAPIRQGDIFTGLPRVDVSLRRIPILESDGETYERDWRDIAQNGEPVAAVCPIRSVLAIVATQDCDAIRVPDITLCEIRRFREVEGKAASTSKAKSWVSILTQQSRINHKWFYLPPDPAIGFTDKMGVDFRTTIRVPRTELEEMRDLRKGRLNEIADEHFRERISEFFRRYPYDEWYPLNNDELEAYMQEYPDAHPYPWQRQRQSP
jgi:hypothetical protein